ncbi:hypothetical protein SCUP515_08272 [Seiridium cupressi]
MAIPFMMKDFTEMQSALDGLKDVTCILNSYNLAEETFLANSATRSIFQGIVKPLYQKLLEYQALVTQYFALSTLRRLGRNLFSDVSWQDGLATAKKAELLCHVPINSLSVRLQQSSFISIGELIQERSNLLKKSIDESSARRAQSQQITEWVSIINSFQDHMDNRRRLGDDYFGSGGWLFRHEAVFQSWQQSRSGVLLLQGVVGTGKSCLVSIVLEYLSTHSDGPVAFFYCSANASDVDPLHTVRNDVTNIFRCILAQCAILADGSIAAPVLEAFNRSHRQGPGESDFGLNATLQFLGETLRVRDDQVTFVFDALDELTDHGTFLRLLKGVYHSDRKLRIFLSSRFGIDVSSEFQDVIHLPINSQNADDIRTYIDNEVEARYRGSGIQEKQAERFKKALRDWSEGVFRWVVLELDIFLPRSRRQGSKFRPSDFEARLSKLEMSRAPAVDRLFRAYEQIYVDALGDDDELSRRYLVKSTMKWVLCSFRPFKSNDLASLVSYSQTLQQRLLRDTDADEVLTLRDSIGTDPAIDTISEEDLLSYCANFIVRSSNGLIRLAHLSVRQFFEEKQSAEFSPPQQHLEVATVCLEGLKGLLEEHNIFKSSYFQKFWPIHVRNAADSVQLATHLETLSRTDPRKASGEIDDLKLRIATKSQLSEIDVFGNSPLHLAVLSNTTKNVELILNIDMIFQRESSFIGSRNFSGDTSLHVAAFHGFDEAFRLLLQAGSTINAHNNLGITALHVAVLQGHEKIIKAARELGAPLDILDTSGGSPLHTAAFCNDSSITQLLLAAGVDAERTNDSGDTVADVAVDKSAIDVLFLLAKATAKGLGNEKKQKDFKAMISSLEDDSDTVQGKHRPSINIKSSNLCSSCDIEEWIEGSRFALTYTHSQSLETLRFSATKGCGLCSWMLAAIEKETSTSDDTDEALSAPEIKVRVSLAADSKVPTSKQDLLFVFHGQRLATKLELCVEYMSSVVPGCYSCLSGQAVAIDASKADLVQEWLRTCQTEHSICSSKSSRSIPTRLVDVGDSQNHSVPRLVEGEKVWLTDNDCRFVFLSWSSGTGGLIEGDFWTRLENVQARLQDGIAVSLPPIMQDTIILCRQIGIRYLVVDAFCLIHDSPEDMAKEVPRIASYILQAELVVAPTKLGNDQHLLSSGKLQLSQPILVLDACSHDTPGDFRIHLRVPLNTAETMVESIFSRSWRAQEVLLAARILIIGDDQMSWICGKYLWAQGSASQQAPAFRSLASLSRLSVGLSKLEVDILGHSSKATSISELFIHSQWYRYVEMISQGKLSLLTDRLPSAEGVAKEVSKVLGEVINVDPNGLQSMYQMGIKMDDLPRSLLWTFKEKGFARIATLNPPAASVSNQPILTTAIQCLVPSWSWASQAAPVSYRLSTSVAEIADFELIQLDYNPPWAKIVVRGYSQRFLPNKTPFFCDLVFDTFEGECMWHEDMEKFTFLVVAQRAYTASAKDRRWIGLIMRDFGEGFMRGSAAPLIAHCNNSLKNGAYLCFRSCDFTSILAVQERIASLSHAPYRRKPTMNAPEGQVKFMPQQAIAPTPQLYDELVSDSMENLAKASLGLIPPICSGAVINDNGCGTGAATAAIVASIMGRSLDMAIKGTDINNSALNLYRKRAAAKSWPAEAIHADSNALTFDADTFTLTIGNALLFVLANDGIDAVKEVHRTLKPGGLAVFNSWKYVPNMAPLEAAAKATRPEGIPLPRSGLDKWMRAEHLRDIIAQGGFDKAQVTMHQANVHVTTSEIDRYVNMLWSFIGGTTPAGWLESDEENWDKALDIIKWELKKTEGYTEIEDGRLRLQFIANIAVAKK